MAADASLVAGSSTSREIGGRRSLPARRAGAESIYRRLRLGRIALYLTALVVVLCPLPYGSVDNLWCAVWCVPLAFALALSDVQRLTFVHLQLLAPAILLAVVTGAVIWLQTVPGMAGYGAADVWNAAEELLKQKLPRTLSLDVAQTWSASVRPLAMFLAFFCGFLCSVDRAGAAILFRVTAYAGAAYAAYGLVALLIDPNALLGTDRYAYVGDLTSTFVNRNTAATFLGCSLILWLVRLLGVIDERLPQTGRTGFREFSAVFLDMPPRRLLVALACTALCLGALLMTRSRAGTLLSLGTAFFVGVLVLRHRLSTKTGALGAVAGVILLLSLILELFGGALAGRIGVGGFIDSTRQAAYSSTLHIIGDYPVLGTGLGSYVEVFPRYRSSAESTAGVWDRAHNVPLEIAAELGLPFTILTLAAWLWGMWRLFRGAVSRRRDAAFPIAAFGMALLGSLHALVDFSPQIAGFGIFWIALIGAGLAQTVSARDLDEAARS